MTLNRTIGELEQIIAKIKIQTIYKIAEYHENGYEWAH